MDIFQFAVLTVRLASHCSRPESVPIGLQRSVCCHSPPAAFWSLSHKILICTPASVLRSEKFRQTAYPCVCVTLICVRASFHKSDKNEDEGANASVYGNTIELKRHAVVGLTRLRH